MFDSSFHIYAWENITVSTKFFYQQIGFLCIIHIYIVIHVNAFQKYLVKVCSTPLYISFCTQNMVKHTFLTLTWLKHVCGGT